MLRVPSIASDRQIEALLDRLTRGGGVVHAAGVWGSSAPMLAAMAATRLIRPILYITAHLDDADDAQDDAELFLGRPVEVFPAWETLPGEGAAAGEIEADRLALCTRLHHLRIASAADRAPVLVAPIQALLQPVPTIEQIEQNTLRLTAVPGERNAVTGPDDLVRWAVDHGYDRLELVESPGDFARRGDIVDIFAPGDTQPLRVQFFEDAIESIRSFDLSTQRSVERLSSVALTAVQKEPWRPAGEATDLLSFLPEDALLVLDGPAEIAEAANVLRRRLDEPDALFKTDELFARAASRPQLHITRFVPAATREEDVFQFEVASVTRFEANAADAVDELVALGRDHEVHVVCDSEGEQQRLREMISEADPRGEAAISTSRGLLHRGFVWLATKTVVVGHHEIFHRHRPVRRIRRIYAGRPIESWLDLNPGDFVVHIVHGIGIYRGLHRIARTGDENEEYLTLEFAEGGVVHVPTSQIDLVQKYIGAGAARPKLSKLGGRRWARTKEQVSEAVADLASRLLETQARRAAAAGISYPPDTEWQREFEAAFPYEETEDQITVAGDIRSDLMRDRPMDRLVCGDVGYGKTELAMRAAFKVMEYGKQVAVLVPTTVLAEQHYENFSDRFASYPFSIGCLSRFRSAPEQRRMIEQLRKGQLDLVIGTHRLLSADVRFADLGLLVIDEEQRFGVEHKEKLRSLRETVDVLTLSATPIPRTLHMSLTGIRDISSLQTPPVDRRSIATRVCAFDHGLIREAILREMNRGGQVFFVHNYVASIRNMADTISSIVPEARVIYGHGQMHADELDEVMHRFVRKEADVLVATTIIESGIDIPTANTIFINIADRFGLADLHQLRGRVGRSSHRAYCYLMLPPDRPLLGKAAKRLKAIEEFSELGAGFRIAMRDLEIRGAGSLLGKEQSGHIAAVGYELYCRLLEQTVRRIKNEPDPTPPPTHLDLDAAAHIPRHYIPADRARIEIYRRVVGCRTEQDLAQLERDITDAFGPQPRAVTRLLELAEIRVHARAWGIRSIIRRDPDLVFSVESLQRVEPLFVDAPGAVRVPDPNTLHLRLRPSFLGEDTLTAVLRNLFRKAKERTEVRV